MQEVLKASGVNASSRASSTLTLLSGSASPEPLPVVAEEDPAAVAGAAQWTATDAAPVVQETIVEDGQAPVAESQSAPAAEPSNAAPTPLISDQDPAPAAVAVVAEVSNTSAVIDAPITTATATASTGVAESQPTPAASTE